MTLRYVVCAMQRISARADLAVACVLLCATLFRAEHHGAGFFADYRDITEVNAYMDAIAAAHPALARTRTLGTTPEGQPLRALELSRGGRLGIVLDGGQHAREWISVMVPLCIADRLAKATDARTQRILDAVSFHVVPIANPDGYRYTWTTDRYWRKTRRDGHGVDLNRNYPVGWGEAGSSDDPRSPNYRGAAPFSEPETRALATLFDSGAIAAHLDFHSYSQVIVYPWSYQRTPPPDADAFAAIADRMATALHAAHGERYRVRAGSELVRGAGGTLTDWSYSAHHALAFTVELRPARGPDGFDLPAEQIVPTCDESLAAVLALADWLIEHR